MAQQSGLLTLVDLAKSSVLAYNEKNYDKMREPLATNVVYDEVGTGRKIQGVNDVLAAFRAWSTAIPDSKATFVNEYVSGNTVVLELVWNGTHTGPLQTPNGQIAPTGKRINVRACEVFDTVNNQVTAIRHYFDMTTLLKQIGVV